MFFTDLFPPRKRVFDNLLVDDFDCGYGISSPFSLMVSGNCFAFLCCHTPIYNRAHLIGATLDSVFVQTFNDYEVIVVNDGSRDGTQDYLKRLKNPDHLAFAIQSRARRGSRFRIG